MIELEASNDPECDFREARTLEQLREITEVYGDFPPPELQLRGRYLHIRITEESEASDD